MSGTVAPREFQKEFLSQLQTPSGLEVLFDYLPEIYFWIKDKHGRFLMANRADVQKCGARNEEAVIGKTDFDFFPAELAENFQKDDQDVIKTGKKIINRVELVPNDDGTISWYSTNKVPLYARDGSIIGVAGTTKNLKTVSSQVTSYSEMSEIIDYISKNYMHTIEIKDLAAMTHLSLSQFERKFKKNFQISPMKFIIKVRIKAACQALVNTYQSVSGIAKNTGFCDQSHFGRQFKSLLGMSPLEYRKTYFIKPETE